MLFQYDRQLNIIIDDNEKVESHYIYHCTLRKKGNDEFIPLQN